MRFLVFVEGQTEAKVLKPFFKKWLDPRLPSPIRVETVRFNGWGEYLAEVAQRAPRDLDRPRADVIAVIGILDIYGLTMDYPKSINTIEDRCRYAKAGIEKSVGHAKFHQFFAVHEIEAWLLSDPGIFPTELRDGLAGKVDNPETVNSQEPPARLLERLYRTKTGKAYKKAIDGPALFSQLDPNVAYIKCPNLKALLDEMLRLAQEAGLG